MRNYLKHLKAFTLIELLIVIGIIGILSGIVIAVINPEKQRGRARDTIRYHDLSALNLVIQSYIAEYDHAPDFQGTCSYTAHDSSCLANETPMYQAKWNLLQQDLSTYLVNGKLPKDPCGIKCFGDRYYTYYYQAPGNMIDYCSQESTCNPANVATYYILAAENLEGAENTPFGFKPSWANSYN